MKWEPDGLALGHGLLEQAAAFLQRAAGEVGSVEPQNVEGQEPDRHLFSHLLDVLW